MTTSQQRRKPVVWRDVVIVVVNWNGWRDTIECLESVRKLDYPDYRVIIVDNGSTDESIERLRAWRYGKEGQFHLVENTENVGFAAGVNDAILHALAQSSRPDFVFLLNNDARLDAAAISECVKVSLDEDAAIVGPVIRSCADAKILFAGASVPHRWLPADWGSIATRVDGHVRCWESFLVEGSAMLIRCDIIDMRIREHGYVLNPALFMYFEETELCRWARARGHRILIAGSATAYHRHGESAGRERNPLASYYKTRNRILLARWLLPTPQRLALFLWYFPSRVIRVAQGLLRGRPCVAKAILCGMLDGCRSATGKWSEHPFGREARR